MQPIEQSAKVFRLTIPSAGKMFLKICRIFVCRFFNSSTGILNKDFLKQTFSRHFLHKELYRLWILLCRVSIAVFLYFVSSKWISYIVVTQWTKFETQTGKIQNFYNNVCPNRSCILFSLTFLYIKICFENACKKSSEKLFEKLVKSVEIFKTSFLQNKKTWAECLIGCIDHWFYPRNKTKIINNQCFQCNNKTKLTFTVQK